MKSGIPYKDAQAWCRQLDDRHNRGAGPMRPRPEDIGDDPLAHDPSGQPHRAEPSERCETVQLSTAAQRDRGRSGARKLPTGLAPQPEPDLEARN